MRLALLILFAYLYGAVPLAYIVTYAVAGKRLTRQGTGNVGVMNAHYVGGVWASAATVLGEISKALLPILVARQLFPDQPQAPLLAVFAAFVGTNWSIFLRGRGGKGFTLLVWSQIILSPLVALVLALIGLPLFWFSRRWPAAKRVWILGIPVAIWFIEGDALYTVLGAAAAAVLLVRALRPFDDFAYWGTFGRRRQTDADLLPLALARNPGLVGHKAANLLFLLERGYAVPPAHVVPVNLYRLYRQEASQATERVRAALQARVDTTKRYAVRSSATVEDSAERSYAGLFESVLNVQGLDALVAAVESVWTSAEAPGVQAYQGQVKEEPLEMAVIIQEMVTPAVSGVAFSRNPTTGMNEIIVEAVRGTGDVLLRGGATPARWVYKWGSWVEQPEDTDIPRAWIEAVIQGIEALTQDVDQPVDAEWVHDGAQLHWVQLREITTFSETDVYSNRISREYFPGIVLPLIWSINVPLVNGAWIRLFTELIGPNDLCADELAHQFYYRAYFNMGAVGHVLELLGMPREGLERMMGLESEGAGTERPRFRPSLRTLRLVPRLLLFLWRKRDVADQVEMFIPTARAQLDNLASADLASLDAPQILDCIDRLYALDQKVAYYNILAPMTMYLSNALLRGWLRRVGLDPEAVDLRGGSVAIQAFDPKVALAQLHASYLQLEPATRDLVLAGDWSGLQMTAGAEPFRRDVHRFLDRFGHLSDSGNDFSVMPWREQPEVVLQMVAGQPAQASGQGQPLDLGRLSWWQRLLLAPAVRRARRALLQREMASSLYTYGYGLFRDYYRALARRLVAQGLLEVVDDIFYLSRERIRDAVINGNTQGLGQEVERVKAEIETVRDVELPAVIYGTEAPPLRSHDSAQSLRGVASSRGRYTGTVRVVQGIADLPRVQQGDVLVVPYSDVGWAPLFARAGALVSQAGGMLSHSSIVARELGIPAVVSVSGAMRLRDGQQVTVDGYRGEIFLLDDETTDQTQVMTQEHEGEV